MVYAQPSLCRLTASLSVIWEVSCVSHCHCALLPHPNTPQWLLVVPHLLRGPAPTTLTQDHSDYPVFMDIPFLASSIAVITT